MTTQQHTQGELKIERKSDYFSVTPSDNKFFEIARVRGFSMIDAEANARLIAASPSLLLALIAIGEAIEQGDPQRIVNAWINQGKKAINKAKGE